MTTPGPMYSDKRRFDWPKETRILEGAARQLGYTFAVVDESYGSCVRIGNGNTEVTLQSNRLTPNLGFAMDLARNKVNTYRILSGAGFRVPEGNYFFAPAPPEIPDYSLGKGRAEAIAYGRELALRKGFPLIVKPNTLGQGIGVSKVFASEELPAAIDAALTASTLREKNYTAIVQECVEGTEFRMCMLDGRLVLAYYKRFPTVVGDGSSSVRALIKRRNEELPPRHRIGSRSRRLRLFLECRGLTLDAVPVSGVEIVVSDVAANLDAGATAHEITAEVSQDYVEWAARLCSVLGLRYGAVDFICPSLEAGPGAAVVLEVNGNPALTHFYDQGNEARVLQIVERLMEATLGDMPRM